MKKRHFYVVYGTETAILNCTLMSIDNGRYINLEEFTKHVKSGFGQPDGPRPNSVIITNIIELSAKDFKDFQEVRSTIEPLYQ